MRTNEGQRFWSLCGARERVPRYMQAAWNSQEDLLEILPRTQSVTDSTSTSRKDISHLKNQ